MRILCLISVVLMVCACGPEKEVVDIPPPVPEVTPEPEIVEKPKPAEPQFKMNNILGLTTNSVEQILGNPSLRRVENTAEVWLYDNQFCNAHVYFYENDNGDLNVEFIETSEEKDLMDLQGQRADFCISTFLQN